MPTDAPAGAADLESRGAVSMFDGLADMLPRVLPPWWVQYIGDPYVCDNVDCAEHRACLDVRLHATPRAACACHNCAQRRWAIARERSTRAATTSPEAQRHAERKQAARKPKRKPSRLERAIAGEHTRARPCAA